MILEKAIAIIEDAAREMYDIELSIIGPNGQKIIVEIEDYNWGEYSFNVEYRYVKDNRIVYAVNSESWDWPEIPDKLDDWWYKDSENSESEDEELDDEKYEEEDLGIDPKMDEEGWRLSEETERTLRTYVKRQIKRMRKWLVSNNSGELK